MIDNQDKQAWCAVGELAEVKFAGPLLPNGGALMLNPAKKLDKYTHDLFITLPSDLKTIRTRFNTAHRYEIDPKSAITLNVKDILRYKNHYPTIIIVFDVDFGDYKRLCYSNLREIRRAIKCGKAKLHTYKDRVDDTNGNAKESYIFDAEWFQQL
jgi:hypothetical protein